MTGYRVPDAIEPIEAFRSWNLVDGKLVSITNGEEWKPGEPLAAKCINGMGDGCDGYRWTFGRGGMSREEAHQHAHPQVDVTAFGVTAPYYSYGSWGSPTIPSPPALEPPDGYGFLLERISHDAPMESCACGVYATDRENRVPEGEVYGKVKLWGKVIPGERGYRAEFAYPSEFWVPSEMEPHDGLLAFDVPIILKEDLPTKDRGSKHVSVYLGGNNLSSSVTSFDLTPASSSGLSRARRVLFGAAAVNLGCAAVYLYGALHGF